MKQQTTFYQHVQHWQTIHKKDMIQCVLDYTSTYATGVKLDKNHWYEHVPKSVVKSQGGKVTILWNQQVQTDRTIPNNKPDIIICDNENRHCNLSRQICDKKKKLRRF
jgi:hypothetical protein